MVCTPLIIHINKLIFNFRYLVKCLPSPSVPPSLPPFAFFPLCLNGTQLRGRSVMPANPLETSDGVQSRDETTGSKFGPRQRIAFPRARCGGRAYDRKCM